MNSAHITKQVHEMTHTPILRVLIRYEFESKRHVHLTTLNAEGTAFMTRTIKWAASKGVEIFITPV